MEKVVETLELAKKRDLTIEINSSGLRKNIREQYPSVEIIEKMYELDIPVLLGSDAHKIDEIAYEFKFIIDLLKKIGYNQLAYYNKRIRTFIEI
jgi:histidinol-phosphatase (PHP family)